MKRNFILSLFLLSVAQLGFSQSVVTVSDADLNNSTTWYSDTVYMLDGFVFLEEGTLTIEAGTVIKGKEIPSTGDNASALIITKGAMIHAVGNPKEPIIFTAEIDDLNDPSDLTTSDRGLWGGVILLGNGILGTDTETKAIEGIPEGESRAEFGGNDNAESSGTMKYVSIRHGGAEIGAGNEINGLTMGGVGSGTVIEHVEVIANDDDGFEWFGGAVGAKWLVSAFNKDDAFDYDFGWVGKGQFWFAIQGTDEADNGGEHDGSKPDDAAPFSNPTIYNATYIGSGTDAVTKNSTALHFRDNAGGMYANSIFTDFAKHAIEVEDLPAASGTDSRQRMEAGDLVLKNNIWFGFGSGDQLDAGANGILRATEDAEDANAQFLIDHLTNNDNSIEDPLLRGIGRLADNSLDPRPSAGSPAFTGAVSLPADDDFYSQADYRGAFAYANWAAQWTAVDEYGIFGNIDGGFGSEQVIITDADLSNSTQWTNDKTYILDGFVFLEEGTLTIQQGTVIKGKEIPTSGDNASALIITRGAQIDAQGSADFPIIFTAEIDDVNDPDDLTSSDRGLWGGIILLGNGILGTDTETKAIEGIPEGESRAEFGGNDNAESSGTMKYVSIRHGGAEIGAGNEINGLTMGGVGSGTVIEHVEVIANDDDGFEWFGGAVGAKWLVSAFNKDDAFDYDFGWVGKGQFWFAIQGTDEADNGGEHDGSKPDDAAPFSNPTIYNATYIGSGTDAVTKNSTALHFRDNAGGMYANSIFTDFAKHAIEVEDLPAASGTDSRQRMEAGDLVLKNNIWFGFGSGDQLDAGANGILRATEDAEDANAQFLIDHLTNNDNSIEDPKIAGISHSTDGGLDPRPNSESPAWENLAPIPEVAFFSDANYKGAFGETNWATGWTAVDFYGYFGDILSGVDVYKTDNGLKLSQNYPNPFNYSTNVTYILPEEMEVELLVFDLSGKIVQRVINNEYQIKGEHTVTISGLKEGMYFYRLSAGTENVTRKMIVTK
ncbi:MAG: T9SS type A sorting domain-containing protein [bacterium]